MSCIIKYIHLTIVFFHAGHRDRPTIVRYHPTADNILTSAGYDLSVNIWDVNKETTALSLSGHLEPVSIVIDWEKNTFMQCIMYKTLYYTRKN